MKLVYLADRYHLRKYGRTVSRSQYTAMNKGPVPFDARNEMDRIGNGWVEAGGISAKTENGHCVFAATKPGEEDMDLLSETDREAMDAAIRVACDVGIGNLVSYTHGFPEWAKHEKELDANDPDSCVPMDVADFFLPAPVGAEYCDADAELVELNKESYAEWPE